MRSFLKSWQFILLFLIFILANFALALYFRLYYLFWWLDIAHHFLGGLWLAFLLNFYLKKTDFTASNLLLLLLLFLGFAALAGVLWELGEFIWNRYIWYSGYRLPNIYATYEDTLSDLFFDLLGVAFGLLLIL